MTVIAWWYKPEYIINDLNINSAITTPCHEEILPINSATTQRPYTLKGYAYSGTCLSERCFVFFPAGLRSWKVHVLCG